MTEASQSPTGKFVWYEYMGPDLEGAAEFYAHVVGWTVKDSGMAGFPYKVASVGDHGVAGLMTLTEDAKAMGVPPCWSGYVYVPDVDAGVKAVEAKGGRLMSGPMEIPGVGRFAVVADPYGAVYMIFKDAGGNPPPAPAAETPGLVGWRELQAGDGAGAFDFYSSLYGWKKDGEFDMGPMGVYHLFSSAPGEGGGMMNRAPQAPGNFWAYYFNVDAIGAAIERLTAKGGKVAFGPNQVPGGLWTVRAIDPQGAYFALLSPNA